MVPAVAAAGPRWQPTAPPATDAGHLLPAAAWDAVVAGVQSRPASRGRALPDRTVTAYAHGGVMTGGPRLGVIHSAETPLTAGYAYSIAANWFATAAAGTSATVMVDPAETVRLLPDNVVAYHVGAKGNGFTVGVEQAGRAAFTRADWLTADGRAQLARVAQYMRECRDRWGIPLRWATDAQIKAAAVAGSQPQGWCTHDDVRRVLGGTTHSDPGTGRYPADELMAAAIGEDDDVALTTADLDAIAARVVERLVSGKRPLWQVLADVDTRTAALVSRDPVVNPVAQAVVDRQVSGTRELWRVLAGLDTDAMADAIGARLAANGGASGLTRADVTAAVREVFADGGQA